jgi:DNA-binding transcriptional MocR family regulator
LILALTAPGDVILAEPMTYPGLHAAASQFGRHVIAVEADKHGMVPEKLEEACRRHEPRLVYLNPTLQNPTAITMPERRRKALAVIAKRCDVRIVEDDPYWLLADAPPPPIATFAPEQVVYISTLSKCLTPGLRVAFVLVRDPHERERFLVALRSFALMAAPLSAALATQWILDGSADGLLEGVRKEARLRHRMARDILAGRYSGLGDGLHVWLELPAYWRSSQLARAAASYGVAVTPAEAFATGSGSANAIRISLGSIQDRGRLRAGLQRLSDLLARRPESFSAAVA